MSDDLYRQCPYRSDEPIGTVNCSCDGHPVAYQCYHIEVNYPVMLTRNRLSSRILTNNDGTTRELVSSRLKDCMTCELRPTDASYLDLPPLSEQLANFGAAVLRFAKAGMPRAPQPVYDQRTQACLACPKLTNEGRCTYCGCWVAEKALWLTEKCPEDRWPKEPDDADDAETAVGSEDRPDEGEDLPELPGTEQPLPGDDGDDLPEEALADY